MHSISEESKINLFSLMRFYSGAQYALEELSLNPSYAQSSNGRHVKEVAVKTSKLMEDMLLGMGYAIRPFVIESHQFRFVSNPPLRQGAVFFRGGGIAFEHTRDDLCMQVTDQARIVADRFLPDSWDFFKEELIELYHNSDIATLRIN